MNLLVIGTGYVGLVAGACFAEMGHRVVCLDIDQEKVKQLNQGNMPIYEPGLEEIVHRNTRAERLFFTCDYSLAVPQSQVCFIAVNTPIASGGKADLSAVEKVARSIGQSMNNYTVIVNKSTVPVGTASFVASIVQEELEKRDLSCGFDVVSNPEFLKEGAAVNDFMKPDRVVVGTNRKEVAEIMREIYSPFMLNHERLIVMDIASAELAKYAANAMLATRISFMNELAHLCELKGADITKVRKAIGTDRRIGGDFLYAGLGFGGPCLPKDLLALIAQAQVNDCETPLLEAVQTTNQKQAKRFVSTILSHLGNPQGKQVALLGLAFKPDTDDMRGAASLVILNMLSEAGVRLRVFDPIATNNAKALLENPSEIEWCSDEYHAAQDADAIVLVTEWKQFRLLNRPKILSQMKGNLFFDGRNQYPLEEMAEDGFTYISIGREVHYVESATPVGEI